jgi:hypothetical protein
MRATFEQYDKDNPEIWGLFVHYCSEAKRRGFKLYGSKAIFEVIRFNTPPNNGVPFKVNNNFTPDYARKMEREFPEFDGFFEKRVLKKVK